MPLFLLFLLLPISWQLAVTEVFAAAQPTTWPFHVPDTGQESCYDNLHKIACPPPGAPFYGQDAQYQSRPPQCEIKKTPKGTLLIDQVTGLTWQAGTAPSELDWSAALDYTNALTLDHHTDWRLPESRELRTIMNFGERVQEKKTQRCPFVQPAGIPCFWSITTRKFPALDAQSTCLDGINQVQDTDKGAKRAVRAVRGTPLPGPSLRDNGDGSVTDLSTGLTWQQTETRPMNWQQALAFCENLDLAGHRDWRLPSIRELQTLVEVSPRAPAIDSRSFPGCRPEPYWSSTTSSERPSFAWTMDFATGREYDGGYKLRLYPVRAVRGGNVSQRQPETTPIPSPQTEGKKHPLRPFPRERHKEQLLEPYPLEMQESPGMSW